MGRRRGALEAWSVVVCGLVAACAGQPGRGVAAGSPSDGRGEASPAREAPDGVEEGEGSGEPVEARRWADPQLGFEISRPAGGAWGFSPGQSAPEGILVPVVVHHGPTGAQVVVQLAPSVAPPEEFALRLSEGLRGKPGFSTSAPELRSDGAASFRFALGELVFGQVRVRAASGGRTFVLLATWPATAAPSLQEEVEQIFASLRTFDAPPAGGGTASAQERPARSGARVRPSDLGSLVRR